MPAAIIAAGLDGVRTKADPAKHRDIDMNQVQGQPQGERRPQAAGQPDRRATRLRQEQGAGMEFLRVALFPVGNETTAGYLTDRTAPGAPCHRLDWRLVIPPERMVYRHQLRP